METERSDKQWAGKLPGKWLYPISILVLVTVGSLVYFWQHNKVKDLEAENTSLGKKVAAAQTKVSQQEESTNPSGVGSESNQQQIHRVASAYLNALKGSKGDDKSKFNNPNESTSIDSSGKFAIQVYCKSADCFTMTLKKVGSTWVVLDTGKASQARHDKLIEDYGWPPAFVSPQPR